MRLLSSMLCLRRKFCGKVSCDQRRDCGEPHTLKNIGPSVLRCIVAGQRLEHDVGDYPAKKKRIYRNKGLQWNLVDMEHIVEPVAGKKA
jgi:uncharacterized cupin superfamily protein